MVKKITAEKFAGFVAALMQKGALYAPAREGEIVNFKYIADPSQVTLDFYNTVISPKGAFFPQAQDMINYRLGKEGTKAEPVSPEVQPQILLGARPCDVRAIETLDLLFKGGGIVDPYWEARRRNTTIIGYGFDSVDPADFYGSFGIGAMDARGSDAFIVRSGNDFLIKGITPKGEELVKALPLDAGDEGAFDAALKRGEALKTRSIALEGVPERLWKTFDSPYWQKAAAACISCGTCTFVCPTCHCFDINDETLFREGKRKRLWDACMFTNFTLEASGHNPRTRIFQRLRQRVMHKFSFFQKNFEVISCVGCGRCTRSCPVNIDILSVVEGAIK